jgi:activator of 2-hydroxyglutaryl-CoA dehydratase
MAVLGDFGTTWTKLLDTVTGERRVLPTREAVAAGLRADIATGHNARRWAPRLVNELIALAQGGERLTGGSDFLLVDVGSRDVKYVRMRNGELAEMDWTATCGALTGFTLELLGKYYNIDYAAVQPSAKSVPVTCGVLGMEQLFELVSEGVPVEEAIARFARGIAMNTHRFIGQPPAFYLSGGMCENRLFIRSFPDGVEVRPLGRFVLVEGLVQELGTAGFSLRSKRCVGKAG